MITRSLYFLLKTLSSSLSIRGGCTKIRIVKNLTGLCICLGLLSYPCWAAAPSSASSTEIVSEDKDILDRQELKTVRFDESSTPNTYSDSVGGELVLESDSERKAFLYIEVGGSQKKFSGGLYYLHKLNTVLKTLLGLHYEEDFKKENTALDARFFFLVGWDRYMLEPYIGLDAGGMILPKQDKYFFSHGLAGLDVHLTQRIGLSMRQFWKVPQYLISHDARLEASHQGTYFEVAFYCKI